MAIEVQLFPWQTQQFEELKELAATKRFGHAWLFTGTQGIGKLGFAHYLANYLFCQHSEAGKACGKCNSCHLFSAGSHPDWRLLQPEKKLITIDQVREAIEFAHNTSQRGSYKILCLCPAEAMNNNAANALLKILEEPPAGTILLLISHQPGMLLPTLRSRCQQLRMALPSTEMASTWLESKGYSGNTELLLQKTGNAPLLALEMSESGLLAEHETIMSCLQDLLAGTCTPVKAARKCEKIKIETTMDFLMQSLAAIISSLQSNQIQYSSQLTSLQQMLPEGRDEQQRLRVLHWLYQALGSVRKTLMSSNNPNHLLILEQVFGDWSKLRLLSKHAASNKPRSVIDI